MIIFSSEELKEKLGKHFFPSLLSQLCKINKFEMRVNLTNYQSLLSDIKSSININKWDVNHIIIGYMSEGTEKDFFNTYIIILAPTINNMDELIKQIIRLNKLKAFL
jgi:hypothetical protein